jgi:CheY-like chemotaxis protein
LEFSGYVVESAANGLRALQVLKETKTLPDLILLDYMMPELDGGEFRVEQLKDKRIASIPILLMTAHAQGSSLCTKTGACDFIKKPIDMDSFLEAVDSVFLDLDKFKKGIPR